MKVNQHEQKQSALEDYVERAVMMQYTNCVVTLSVNTIFVDYTLGFFYYAPLCLYALTSYHAQNYANIIRQGLLLREAIYCIYARLV